VSGIEASNAGQKSLEHMNGVPLPFEKTMPQFIEAARKNGTWVCPTLITHWNRAHFQELPAKYKNDPRMQFTAPVLKRFWMGHTAEWSSDTHIQETLLQWRTNDVKTLHDDGIPIIAGTDLGFYYVFPGDLRAELAYYVEAGLSPLDAIRTATINPAIYLNREKELGSVEKGKLADFVMLDANPLDDIHNLHLIRTAVFNGRFFDRAALDAIMPKF